MEKKEFTLLNSRREAAKQHLTGWTFMVFIAGDNNLDPAALKDITEMAKVGSSEDLNIIVQLDRANDLKIRRFYITKGGGYRNRACAMPCRHEMTIAPTETGSERWRQATCK